MEDKITIISKDEALELLDTIVSSKKEYHYVLTTVLAISLAIALIVAILIFLVLFIVTLPVLGIEYIIKYIKGRKNESNNTRNEE